MIDRIITFQSVPRKRGSTATLAILWRNLSSIKAGFHMIADDRGSQIAKCSAIVCDHVETHFCDRLRSCDRDRRRSQTIAEDRTMFYLLRSFAIHCDRAIIWRSAIETYPIIFLIPTYDSTLLSNKATAYL